MHYGDLVERLYRENKLFSVLMELTYRCNLDCFICYNDRQQPGESLSLDQYYQLLQDLQKMQVMNITLSGGEPLAHPDFWKIGARGRALGFVMRIKSNGHALRPEVIQRLQKEIDPYSVEISLHGATAETHDRQTRSPGSFMQLRQNLLHMKKAGLRVQLNCPLTRWAEPEVEMIYEIADELGYPLIFDSHITPRDNGDKEPQSIAPTDEGLRKLFHLQKIRGALVEPVCGNDQSNTQTAERKHCGTGSMTLAIDPYGTVYPCVALRRPAGSLHEHSVTEIWDESIALKGIRKLAIEAASNVASLGPYTAMGGFCPGLSDMLCGDPATVHPGVVHVGQLKRDCLKDDSI